LITISLYSKTFKLTAYTMLRHIPVLAQEIYDHMPDHRTHTFDGTFGHGKAGKVFPWP